MKLTCCIAGIGILCACAIGAEPAGNVSFKVISAADNGTADILTKRRAEVLERRGGKLGSHDWWLHGVTAFDYDNDGDLDLLVTIHGGRNGVLVKNLLREEGKVRFVDVTKEVGLDFVVPSADKKPWIWDFDGDGWLDIAGFSDETKNSSFFNRQGKRFVEGGWSFNPTSYPRAIVDLNGDGFPDLDDPTHQLQWIYDPTARIFARRTTTAAEPAGLPEAVKRELAALKAEKKNRFLRLHYDTAHDLNGDGSADLVVGGFASYGGRALGRYLIANGDGTTTDRTGMIGLPGNGVPILIADLDGKGTPDVLIAAEPEGGLYTNDRTGNFMLQAGPLTDFLRKREPYPHRAFTVDFDLDGDLDLVVSSPRYGQEAIFENLGSGRFRLVEKARGWDSEPIAICDLNDDGLLDVVIGGPDNGVTIYLNESANPGRLCRISPRMEAPNVNAIGARVEVFRAGEMGAQGTRPFRVEAAHADRTPIFVGLGKASTFDLRVTFPNGKRVEQKGVEARSKLVVTPDGITE